MLTAKIVENGYGQAVRLPEEYRFEQEEVTINKVGDVVFLIPRDSKWRGLLQSLELFSDDYMRERGQGEFPEREDI